MKNPIEGTDLSVGETVAHELDSTRSDGANSVVGVYADETSVGPQLARAIIDAGKGSTIGGTVDVADDSLAAILGNGNNDTPVIIERGRTRFA